MRITFMCIISSLIFFACNNAESTAQATIETNEWRAVGESNSTYYLEKEYVEPVTLVESVPTYDQGLMMRAKETPLDKYLYNYYFKNNDELAFSVEVIALKENPEEYQFQGDAVWYYPDGNLKAKGAYDSDKLTGKYIEYDKTGEIIAERRYMAGEELDIEASVYEPLLGKWVHIQQMSDNQERRVYNVFRSDGTLIIASGNFVDFMGERKSLTGLNEQEFVYKFEQKGEGSGELTVYYPDGKLLGIETVTLDGDQLNASVKRHQDPAMVGSKMIFDRVNE